MTGVSYQLICTAYLKNSEYYYLKKVSTKNTSRNIKNPETAAAALRIIVRRATSSISATRIKRTKIRRPEPQKRYMPTSCLGLVNNGKDIFSENAIFNTSPRVIPAKNNVE